MKIKIVNKSNNPLPSYAHEGDACMDIRANFTQEEINNFPTEDAPVWWASRYQGLVIEPGERTLIKTGLYTEFDEGELQIRPRSGLALKHGVTVLNTPGCVDKNYRNEIGVILYNGGSEPFLVCQGDRIAQMKWSPVEPMEFEEVKELSDSERGMGGFGSSGVK